MGNSPFKQLKVTFRDYRRSQRARAKAGRIPGATPIFVHSHGKVGSSTVTAMLHDALGDAHPVYHTHLFSKAGRDRARAKYAAGARGGSEGHLIHSDAIAPYLDALPFSCRVITQTRNPVGRAISHTFQTLRHWAPPDAETMDPAELVGLATKRVDKLLSPDRNVSDPSEWFDSEVKDIFGVDVFAEPYDFARGYSLLENGPIRVLVIRMEDLDRAVAPALSELMGTGIQAKAQRNANVGAAKWYGPMLQEVKRTYQPSSAQTERVLSGRYYQHFYAADPALTDDLDDLSDDLSDDDA